MVRIVAHNVSNISMMYRPPLSSFSFCIISLEFYRYSPSSTINIAGNKDNEILASGGEAPELINVTTLLPTGTATGGDGVGLKVSIEEAGNVNFDSTSLFSSTPTAENGFGLSEASLAGAGNNVLNNYHVIEPMRPVCLVEYEQQFIQSAIEQFALLFEDRPVFRSKAAMKDPSTYSYYASVHVQLCDR
jgi:hypothetical protein